MATVRISSTKISTLPDAYSWYRHEAYEELIDCLGSKGIGKEIREIRKGSKEGKRGQALHSDIHNYMSECRA